MATVQPSGLSMDQKLKQKKDAVVRAASPAPVSGNTPAPANKMVLDRGLNAAGPVEVSRPAEPVNKMVLDPGKNAGGPVDVAPPPPPPKPPAPAKSAFDLQREQVVSDRMAEEKRRVDAVERMLSNRGLGDSGILAGAERAERANVAQEAGRAMSAIGQQEAQQAFAASEADKDRAITREGMAQAKELALAGLDIQKTSLALQEKGMSQQQAQFTASLAQADKHAQMGFTLQESAQDLTRQGMDIQQAQFTASLGQARYLAERGFDIESIRTELQRQGLDQQQAQFAAGLAHQEKMFELQTDADIQKGIIADAISRIDPRDPNYQYHVGKLLQTYGKESVGGIPAPITPSSLPPGTRTPNSGKWTTVSRASGRPVVYYYNPDTDSYQETPNPVYAEFYK